MIQETSALNQPDEVQVEDIILQYKDESGSEGYKQISILDKTDFKKSHLSKGDMDDMAMASPQNIKSPGDR